MAKIKIEAYIEEKVFTNKNGESVNYLSLIIPVTDTSNKSVKVEQFVLQLAKERAEKLNKLPFTK